LKTRYSLKFRSVQGEAAAVDDNVVSTWVSDQLPMLLINYGPDDVFNADETGLFYEMLPSKTLAFSSDSCSGGKKSKQRLTVLLGSNASGTEKLDPLVIGRSENPRAFKVLARDIRGKAKTPVPYKSNTKSWMTTKICAEWLRKWNAALKLKSLSS